MANPPPVRPWFRLASIRSTPTPAPAPEPRPVMPVPAFRTASAPSSPQTQPTQDKRTPSPPSPPPPPSHNPLSTSLPSSPLHKPSSSPTPKPPSPHHSPKTIKQTHNNSPPPSPLSLPPSQLKPHPDTLDHPEPKTVLVQKTVDKPKPKPWHNGTTSESPSHHPHNHHGKHAKESEKGFHRKGSDSEESGTRVVTIAGENRGAYMELTQSPKKHEAKYLHKKGNSNVKVDGVEFSEGSNHADEDAGNTHKKKDQKGRTFPMAAYMNSNVQCVNNSLLFHTSCSHHDPGVRLSLTKNPFALKEHVHATPHNT